MGISRDPSPGEESHPFSPVALTIESSGRELRWTHAHSVQHLSAPCMPTKDRFQSRSPNRSDPLSWGLLGFSHKLILWWCDRVDTKGRRSETTCTKPYTKGPETIGIFATRSRSRCSRRSRCSASIPPRASSGSRISMPTTARRCSTSSPTSRQPSGSAR